MMPTYNPTFRGSQHSETPDLPFGQVATTGYQGISYSIQPDRAPYQLFQQVSQRRAPKFDYVLNGTSIWYGEFNDKRMKMTETLANMYRGIGYKVVKVSPEVEPAPDPEQTNGKPINPTRAQILSIVRDEYSDDIALLHSNSVKLGNALQSAYDHRMEIESKVGNDLIEHQEFHSKLSSLGKSVSDVSSALGIHKAEFDVHKTHDLIPKIPPIPPIIPTSAILVAAGLGIFYIISKRKKR